MTPAPVSGVMLHHYLIMTTQANIWRGFAVLILFPCEKVKIIEK